MGIPYFLDACLGYHPHFAYWSIDPNDLTTKREGLWNEDGYAKIKVTITYRNQFNPVYVADEYLISAHVNKAQCGDNKRISESMKDDLRARGAIFDDAPGDRPESRTLIPR